MPVIAFGMTQFECIMPMISIGEGNFKMRSDHAPHHARDEACDYAWRIDNTPDGVEHIKI